MKQYAMIGAALLLLMFVSGNAVAGHGQFDEDGLVPLGTPVIHETGLGISAELAACAPDTEFDGIDGKWFNIDGYGEHEFTLTMDAGADYDIFFYNSGCGPTGSVGNCFMDLGVPDLFDCATEVGTVPADSAFALVHNYAGVGGFNLQIE